MELPLTGVERTILRETVEKAVNDLLMEIANTDSRRLREQLRERESVLIGLLGRLQAEEHAA